MDVTAYTHQASIVINRAPEELYDMVSDVSQMGRWSPVCTGGTYDDDRAWFTGTNAMGEATWETRCRVVVADRGREFAFVNHGLDGIHEMVRWGFRFEPATDGGTTVTQSWEVCPTYPDGLGLDEEGAKGVLDMMKQAALQGMPETLAALKRDAGSSSRDAT
jgi:ribosome-associated toxin RatA of RatAB toxin-antitoxin module